jgi:hypothetical protein
MGKPAAWVRLRGGILVVLVLHSQFGVVDMDGMVEGQRDPGGFISAAESAHFTDVVRRTFSGTGVIVDAGCFLGSSTLALCSGLPDRHLASGHPAVIAIDRFIATDRYLVEHFAARALDIRNGECFLDVFLKSVAKFLPCIEVRAGELVRVGRIDLPIEVLVVDIAKSAGLNAYVVTSWFNKLIPGHSCVIQQDFYAPSHLWIAVTMGSLLDYFSISDVKVGESATFQLEATIPPAAIREAVRIEPLSLEGMRCIEIMLERIPELEQPPLLIMKALIIHRLGRTADARRILEDLISRAEMPRDPKWRQWLGMAIVAIDPNALASSRTIADVYLADACARMS